MAVDAVIGLMEICPQSESASELAKTGLGFEHCHLELSELHGSEALVCLQSIVAALGHSAFHFLLVAGDFESTTVVLAGVESGCACVAFLEGSDFAFVDGCALEDTLSNALAEGCGACEEALLGNGKHGLLLAAALGAAAQKQVARGVLAIGDLFSPPPAVRRSVRSALRMSLFQKCRHTWSGYRE
jgi:hypothetical protein